PPRASAATSCSAAVPARGDRSLTNMHRIRIATLAVLTVLPLGARPSALLGQSKDFSWDGRMAPGHRLYVRNLNGAIRVDRATGATSEVEASTVNGGVEATSSGGPVRASTVNGDVDVRMRELGRGDLEYSTVNGSVRVEVPDGLDADVDMRTVNGSIRADFPLTLEGRINPRHIRATIGKGGRRLK